MNRIIIACGVIGVMCLVMSGSMPSQISTRQHLAWTPIGLAPSERLTPNTEHRTPNAERQSPAWTPIGLSGGGGLFTPAISPADPKRMMVNCDMSAAYLTDDGGMHWTMIHELELHSSTRCRPAFHPTDPLTIYAADGGADNT